MAALTSAGSWPGTANNTFTAQSVYRPLRPRATAAPPASAALAAAGTGAAAGGSTSFPAAPAFTRFPVTP